MKYIKASAIAFALTLVLSAVSVGASDWLGFSDVTVKRSSGSTYVSTQDKHNYGYQSASMTRARDDLSSDNRAMQAKVTNSSWIDLRGGGKNDKFNDAITYFASDGYQHHVKAKKSTLSTVSYWGFWFWDVEMPID